MTAWLDTAAADRAASGWGLHAEQLHRSAFELEHRLADVALGHHTSAARRLTLAATELWMAATITRRAAQAANAGDAFDPEAELVHLAAIVGAHGAPPVFSPTALSSAFGDRGGTGHREVRTPYVPSGDIPVERARHLVARALGDTGDARRIRPDEFGLVRVDDTRWIIVLPGVVDLSIIDPGWSDQHRSVRDLDRAAVRSYRSIGVAANPYAGLVRDGLAAAQVPPGSELLVVGHSFGADTALDLAADPAFNGPGGYRVTHVVAAGYHSAPQLPSVAPGTDVLVLQNHRDIPVIVEAVGDAHVVDAIAASAATATALASLDPPAAARAHARSIGHQLGALWSAGRHVVARADDLADVVVGAATTDPARVHDGAVGLVTLEPRVDTPAPGQVVSVFEGGGDGAGHRQDHYVEHIRATEHPAVLAFLASLDAAGYAAPGMAMAVDVSMPSSPAARRRDPRRSGD